MGGAMHCDSESGAAGACVVHANDNLTISGHLTIGR
jgi:hypothetical protein